MSRERFEELVRAALDDVPAELAALVDNCVVLVEDDPPEDTPDLLGVYEGTPLTERGHAYSMALPDRITVFRNPILALCETDDRIVTAFGLGLVVFFTLLVVILSLIQGALDRRKEEKKAAQRRQLAGW